MEIGVLTVSLSERTVQGPPRGEADHLDQPVDGLTPTANRQAAAPGEGKWHHPDIDIAYEPAVETRFVPPFPRPRSGDVKSKPSPRLGLLSL